MTKKFIRFAFAISIVYVVISCNDKPAEKTIELHSSAIDLKSIANALSQRMNIQSGEKVFIVGKPGEFDSLVLLLANKISSTGGIFLGAIM